MTTLRGLWTRLLTCAGAAALLAGCASVPVESPRPYERAAPDQAAKVDGRRDDAPADGDLEASPPSRSVGGPQPAPSRRESRAPQPRPPLAAARNQMGVIPASTRNEAPLTGGVFGRRRVAPTPTIDRDNGLVHLLFGANRRVVRDALDDQPGRRLTAGRTQNVTYGALRVSIPPTHRPGQVERPLQLQTPFGTIRLGEEDADKHIVMADSAFLTPEQFAALAQRLQAGAERFDGQALVFVHGFNNTFETAAYRTAQIVWDLQFDGAAYFYSWPSRGALNRQGYQYDRESVLVSREPFRAFLEHVAETSDAERIHVIAHSMGALLTMETLRDINRERRPEAPLFGEVVLAAPDIDRDVFRQLSAALDGVAEAATLYASSRDKALEVAGRWAAGPRAGDVPRDGPVIAAGVDTVDASDVSLGLLWSIDHSRFAESPALIDDLDELLRQGLRPPSERTPLIEQIIAPQGAYWRFAAPQ